MQSNWVKTQAKKRKKKPRKQQTTVSRLRPSGRTGSPDFVSSCFFFFFAFLFFLKRKKHTKILLLLKYFLQIISHQSFRRRWTGTASEMDRKKKKGKNKTKEQRRTTDQSGSAGRSGGQSALTNHSERVEKRREPTKNQKKYQENPSLPIILFFMKKSIGIRQQQFIFFLFFSFLFDKKFDAIGMSQQFVEQFVFFFLEFLFNDNNLLISYENQIMPSQVPVQLSKTR